MKKSTIRTPIFTSRSLRATATGASAILLTTALLLSAAPAQADSTFGGGGGIMPSPPTKPWEPANLNKFLSECGEACTITNGTFTGTAREGIPERVSDIHDTCAAGGSFAYTESETKSQGLVVDIQLGGDSVKFLPKISYSNISTKTVGYTDTTTQEPYHRYWLDKIKVTQALTGTWHLNSPDEGGAGAFTQFGPRDWNNITADVSFTVLRKQSRPYTEEEKKTLCGNHSPA